MFFVVTVIIFPPSPDSIYTVEVQRVLTVTCSGSNSDDIVAWIRKTVISYSTAEFYTSVTMHLAEGIDPSTVGITPEISSTDPFCAFPMPFLRNTNSSTAILMSDEINGTQPEHAGVYSCYSNGLPRDTVEIVVLGNKTLQDSCSNITYLMHFVYYSSFGVIICI